MIRYFEMSEDVYVSDRWYLADPIDRNGRKLQWVFSRGEFVQVDAPLRAPFSKYAEKGRPVDFSELSAEIVPVVHVRVAHLFVEIAPLDVQIVPVEIDGYLDQFCIVNVVRVV